MTSPGDESTDGPGPVACGLCGETAEPPPLTWTTSVERGRTIHYCERCSRENVRSIEGRLDAEWW